MKRHEFLYLLPDFLLSLINMDNNIQLSLSSASLFFLLFAAGLVAAAADYSLSSGPSLSN